MVAFVILKSNHYQKLNHTLKFPKVAFESFGKASNERNNKKKGHRKLQSVLLLIQTQ